MRIRLLIFIAIIYSFSAMPLFAQFEMKNWYFGSNIYGIQYNYGSPSYSIISNQNASFGFEGATTVNNPGTGNLMFYTDGITVYDANHTAMPGGTGLLGQASTAQSGFVCPVPGQCNKYYVFSNSCIYDSSPSGVLTGSLHYSVVDMSLPGNGTVGSPLGAMVPGQVNQLITTGISEGATLVKKNGSQNYWLITSRPAQNTLVVYEVGPTGVTFHASVPIGATYTRCICIQASPDRSKVAISSHIAAEPMYLFDFNATTGLLSSPFLVPGTNFPSASWSSIYDIEFSEDGSKMYFTKYRMNHISGPGGRFYQYDLNSPATPAFMLHQLSTDPFYSARGLKRGPDGKILFTYVNPVTGGPNLIGAINTPNNAGAACGFQLNFLSYPTTNPGNVHKLPQFLPGNSAPVSNAQLQIQSSCNQDSIITIDLTSISNDSNGDSLIFSGISSSNGFLVNISGSNLSITLPYGFSGVETINYTVCDDQCFQLCSSGEIVLNITTTTGGGQGPSLGPDTGYCQGSSVQLNSNLPSGVNCLWNTGANANSIVVNGPGVYWAEVTNACGTYRDSIFVLAFPSPTVQLPADTTSCNNAIFPFTLAANGYASVIWSTGANTPTIAVNTSGTYSVVVSNSFGCTATDNFVITQLPSPIIDLGQDQVICQGSSVSLNVSTSPGENILWSTGSTANGIIVANTSVIWATIDNGSCVSSDTVSITISPLPLVDLGPDTILCGSAVTYLLDGGNPGATFTWSTGENTQTIVIDQAGTFNVQVLNNGCSASDTVTIDILSPQSLPSEIDLCFSGELTLSMPFIANAEYLWSTGDTTPYIVVTQPGQYSVDVDLGSCQIQASTMVSGISNSDATLIPNVFSPNNDGINDSYTLLLNGCETEANIRILDRWGLIMFSSEHLNFTWDGKNQSNGKDCPDGVYFVVLQYRFGTQNKTYTGSLTLMR